MYLETYTSSENIKDWTISRDRPKFKKNMVSSQRLPMSILNG
ncbi:TPA: hypothetical protein ACG3IY_001168 [Clostridioides difficile]|nr:hypothetical protein [Clostridioides difficile]